MPYTPYHFGPSSLIGLILRRWVDIPVFVLVNIAIDIEIFVAELWHPRGFGQRYAHTLLIGTAVGIIWGTGAYFFRGFFKWIMDKIQIPYKTSISKMIFSGIFGAWAHIFIDALYQSDVMLFWPSRLANPLRLFGRRKVDLLCVLCFLAAFVVYIWILAKRPKKILEQLEKEKSLK
jgi:membrane-bound metal-dependent hydrolase YbcI (DUF457 family)